MARQKDGSYKFHDEYRGWKIIGLFSENSLSLWNSYIECLYDPKDKAETINIISQTTVLSGGLNGVWRVANRIAKEMIDFQIDRQQTDDQPPNLIEANYDDCPF